MSTAADAVPIKLPKFLVTTLEPKSQDGDKVVFTCFSEQNQSSELPLFLVDVKYEDKASVAAEWKDQPKLGTKTKPLPSDNTKIKSFVDAGEGDFSGRAVSQAEFTTLLAKEGKELLFYLHGMAQQTKHMVEATDSLQTNFDSEKPEKVLVVPVDWACADQEVQGWKGSIPLIGAALRYYDDGKSAELAGTALWKLFTGLKKEMGSEKTLGLSVMAHSMGNRVLRCMGKEAVKGDTSWNEEGLQGKSLLQAAPADLKNHENLFENIFFVAADIPECVFEEPDGPHVEQAEHALQSGVAALAVMTKRMHVLHGNGTDEALSIKSVGVNEVLKVNPKAKARLGSRGPWSSKLFGLIGERSTVWDKIGDALDKYEGIEADGNTNNGNVHVEDCTPWNTVASCDGHSYQFAPKAVAYYFKHMTKGM